MLKQLIQRLLDSRTTPAQAAHSAMPSIEGIQYVDNPEKTGNWVSLIAPFDGFITCKGVSTKILIENSSSQWSGTSGITGKNYLGFTLPVQKGTLVSYQVDHDATQVFVHFSKLIGGGS